MIYLFQTDSSQPGDSVLLVTVSFDGTWAKRCFTSSHGVGFVISTDTGKDLDYAVISKAYNACNINQKRLSQEDFELWRADHDCVGVLRAQVQAWKLNMLKYYGTEVRIMA